MQFKTHLKIRGVFLLKLKFDLSTVYTNLRFDLFFRRLIISKCLVKVKQLNIMQVAFLHLLV